jgi:hypothetical protein
MVPDVPAADVVVVEPDVCFAEVVELVVLAALPLLPC